MSTATATVAGPGRSPSAGSAYWAGSGLVALGPIDYFAGQNKVLKAGDTITVTGSMISVDDTPLMIATKIKEGNKEMQVRDNEGYPIWMGWRKTK